jgi:NTE family protein
METHSEIFAGLEPRVRRTIQEQAEWISLAAGSTLFEIGEPANALYLLLSGSMGVYVPSASGGRQLAAIIRQGETVGEMGLISGQGRSATVVAIRDCELMQLTKSRFDQLLRNEPKLMAGLNRLLVHRLRQALHGANQVLEPRTVALLPCCNTMDIPAIARRLADELAEQGLRSRLVGPEHRERPAGWFTRQEQNHDHVIFHAGTTDRDWIRQCARQADRILVVGAAGRPSVDGLPRDLLKLRAEHQLLDLVVVHEGRGRPNGSSAWLDKLPVNRHFHVRLDGTADWSRLARVIGGRGVGVVLSGGGARAYAHIGALRALEEADVPIDFLGGSSMGAIIAASYAVGWNIDELTDRIRRTFVETNPLSDYTLPILSLVRGHKVKALLEEHLGGIDIADTWKPYFCISSNLTSARAVVHRRGNLVEALRATIALPGILPPIITDEGVLADGAVLNNLPVDVMRSTHRGPIAAVDVARDLALDPEWLRHETRSWSLRKFWRPPIISLLIRAGTVTGEEQSRQQAEDADLLFTPPLGNVEIRDWKAFDRTILIGYEHAQKVLKERGHVLQRRRHVTMV